MLSREEIEKLPAGRELDMLISIHVIGAAAKYLDYTEEYWERLEDRSWEQLPYYSADIAAAWLVVEALKGQEALRYDVRIDDFHRAVTVTVFDPYAGKEVGQAIAPAAPLAICRAALLALSHESGGLPAIEKTPSQPS